jgi:Outer membrane cytochrome MtrC/MtrF-like, domains II/IV
MRRMGFWCNTLLAGMMVGTLALAGCAGDDGSTGAQGPEGPPGPVTTTNESCAVCHNAGKIADATDEASGSHNTTFPQVTVTVDSAQVVFVDDDADPVTPDVPQIQLTFTPADDAALALYGGVNGFFSPQANNPARFNYLRIAYARLNAAGQWVRYTSGDRDPSHLTDNGDGSYTMATNVSLNDYAADMPTRALIVVARISETTAPLDVIYDFVPDGSAATVTRDVVTEDACNSCHGTLANIGVGHSDRYLVAACVVCHADKANSADAQGISTGRELAYMIHAIHSEQNLNDNPDVTRGHDDWSEVTYPQNVKSCAKCHTGVADADNYKVASILACTGCHINDTFVGADATHSGGPQVDADCHTCHPTSAVPTYHAVTAAAADTPEFDVTITMDTPANGTYYVEGEAPMVTVTLKKHADGTDVDPSVYTAAKDAAGVAGGGLANANLMVYGPRSKAVPVLTTGSTTDPNLAADTLPT